MVTAAGESAEVVEDVQSEVEPDVVFHLVEEVFTSDTSSLVAYKRKEQHLEEIAIFSAFNLSAEHSLLLYLGHLCFALRCQVETFELLNRLAQAAIVRADY